MAVGCSGMLVSFHITSRGMLSILTQWFMFSDWNQTALGYSPLEIGEYKKVLPLVIQYLTPEPVAVIGRPKLSLSSLHHLKVIRKWI